MSVLRVKLLATEAAKKHMRIVGFLLLYFAVMLVCMQIADLYRRARRGPLLTRMDEQC